MPSPIAQAALIQETYKRAGLDLSRPSDRPQYFEAHGTGTPAGDPVESRAISTAFFGPKSGFKRSPEDPKLVVGSIKTVIGHTEGTAGLASLLKVSLALQNGKVPPNLHFEKLSATVKPHFTNLDIPTSLRDWPQIPEGGVKRASVNSFGFGGAVSSTKKSTASPSATLTRTNTAHRMRTQFLKNTSHSLPLPQACLHPHLLSHRFCFLRPLRLPCQPTFQRMPTSLIATQTPT